MYKPDIYRYNDSASRDSGSESAPLLSSESRTSLEPAAFNDLTETSDLDLSSTGCSLKYVSFEMYRLHSCYLHAICNVPSTRYFIFVF